MSRRPRNPFPLLDPLEPRLFLARDFYVDAHAPSLTPTGSSWELAYQDLQQALTQASPGDRILVADGTYTPTPTKDRTLSFILKNNVQLLGGHAGYGAPNPNTRDTTLYPSILSGNIGNPDSNADNSYHVVIGSDTDSSALLDGFTITAGNANGTWPYGSGGGMYIASGNPTLRNCTFSGNTTSYDGGGGGIYSSRSSPTFTNCTFSGNFGYSGGGMCNSASSPILTNCTFSLNSSRSGGGMDNFASAPILVNCTFSGNSANSDGGGICNINGSAPALNNCTFSGNSASSNGGGIYCDNGSASVLSNCTFANNSAFSGGGMYNLNSSATLTNCTFTANAARADGGGLLCNSSSPTLTNCSFTANSASAAPLNGGGGIQCHRSSPTLINCSFTANFAKAGGGGIHNNQSSPTILNCSFSGNAFGGIFNFSSSSPTLTNCSFSGNSGGGMYNDRSSPTLTNCTFAANFDTRSGGGIYNYYQSSPTITNCIFWGNSPRGIQNYYSTPTVRHSLIQGGYEGPGNLKTDPQFLRNPSPGDDATWGTADDDYGDLRLRLTSPAIDAGDNDATTLTADLANNPRRTDIPTIPDTGLGAAPIIDLGAYEAQPHTLSIYGAPGPDTYYLILVNDDLHIIPAPSGQSTVVPFSSLNVLTFDTLAGDDRLILDFSNGAPIPPGGLLFNAGEGTDTITVAKTRSFDGLSLDASRILYDNTLLDGPAPLNLPVHLASTESTTLRTTELAYLNLSNSAHAAIAAELHPEVPLQFGSLALDATSTLDLTNHTLNILSGDATTIESRIASARNNGLWTGPGITTSSFTPYTTLALFPGPKGELFIRYTYYGDINADGQVNLTDYFTIDSGYLNKRTGFSNGDVNLDGEINLADYFLIDSAYLNQKTPLASPSSFSIQHSSFPSPSPSSLPSKKLLKAPKKKPHPFSPKKRIHR